MWARPIRPIESHRYGLCEDSPMPIHPTRLMLVALAAGALVAGPNLYGVVGRKAGSVAGLTLVLPEEKVLPPGLL